MLTLHFPAELARARLPSPLNTLAATHLRRIHEGNPHYNPADDGCLVIITQDDTDSDLGQTLGPRWRESLSEGVNYDQRHRCFITLILHGNQRAITILVPDELWLDPPIRQRLLAEMDDWQPLPPLPNR